MSATSPGSQSENGGCFSQTTGKKDGFTNQTRFLTWAPKGEPYQENAVSSSRGSPHAFQIHQITIILSAGKALFRRLFIPVQGLGLAAAVSMPLSHKSPQAACARTSPSRAASSYQENAISPSGAVPMPFRYIRSQLFLSAGKALFRRPFIPVQGLGCLPPFQCPYDTIRRRPLVHGQALVGWLVHTKKTPFPRPGPYPCHGSALHRSCLGRRVSKCSRGIRLGPSCVTISFVWAAFGMCALAFPCPRPSPCHGSAPRRSCLGRRVSKCSRGIRLPLA